MHIPEQFTHMFIAWFMFTTQKVMVHNLFYKTKCLFSWGWRFSSCFGSKERIRKQPEFPKISGGGEGVGKRYGGRGGVEDSY